MMTEQEVSDKPATTGTEKVKYGREGLEERVQKLAESLDFESFISPKQRRLGPKKKENAEAESGKPGPIEDESNAFEVFLGALGPDVFEDELYQLASSKVDPASIELIRVMTGESGENRGFAFIRLLDKDSCLKLCRELNGYEFRPKRHIDAKYSRPSVRIFVANLPKNKDKDELKAEFEKATDGVKDVILHQGGTKNRGFCFVDYFSHQHAKSALWKLGNAKTVLFGRVNVHAEWAEPIEEADPEVMAKVRSLYIKHVPVATTEAQLSELFGAHGELEKVQKNPDLDYAFVYFKEREGALKAMEALNGHAMGDSVLAVDLARPNTGKKPGRGSFSGGQGGGDGHFGGGGGYEASYFGRGYGRGGPPPPGRGFYQRGFPSPPRAFPPRPFPTRGGRGFSPARGAFQPRGGAPMAFPQRGPPRGFQPPPYEGGGYDGYYEARPASARMPPQGAYQGNGGQYNGAGESFYEDTEGPWQGGGYDGGQGGAYGAGVINSRAPQKRPTPLMRTEDMFSKRARPSRGYGRW